MSEQPATGRDRGGEPHQPQSEGPAGRDPADSPTGELIPASTQNPREEIDEPARLLRIASTVRAMLEEVQTTELDEAARQRLTEIHNRTVEDLRSAVSEDLRRELELLSLEPDGGTPSGAELRVMQAQLSGWLQGLFHGIQASIATQQMAAQQQLRRMRGDEAGPQGAPVQTGQYL